MRKYIIEKDFIINGYRCVIVGQSMGHRCGYVGIPEGHRLYSKDYDEVDVTVHGGLTYAGGGIGSVYPVESDLWWFGFDCAHLWDAPDPELIRVLSDYETCRKMLYIENRFPSIGVIRTKDFVEKELIRLVDQIIEMSGFYEIKGLSQ